MNKLLKNKTLLIASGVALIVIAVLLGVFLFLSKSTGNQVDQSVTAYPTQVPIPSIAADALGLTLKDGTPGQTVIATITKTEGISSVEYEMDYVAKNPTLNSTDRIPRQVIGSFDVTKMPFTKEIKLGTCSDVCHYDQDITDVKIVLKITKADGKIYQSEAKLSSVSQ